MSIIGNTIGFPLPDPRKGMDMAGNRISNLANPLNSGDAANKQYVDESANELKGYADESAREIKDYVDKGFRPAGWLPTAEEIGAAPAIESTEHPGCFYRTVDGVTEWLNPPMEVGVEYRTTERYEGSPVYTKLIAYSMNASGGSSGATVAIPHGISNFGQHVRIYGRIGTYVLPSIEGYDTLTGVLTVDATNITVRLISSNFSGASCFHLHYTQKS